MPESSAKRHKVLRDNIQGITAPAIRRVCRRGGVKRLSGLIYEETRGVLKVFLENVIRDAVTYTEHARMKTVKVMHVVHALKRQGRVLYGYDEGGTEIGFRGGAKKSSTPKGKGKGKAKAKEPESIEDDSDPEARPAPTAKTRINHTFDELTADVSVDDGNSIDGWIADNSESSDIVAEVKFETVSGTSLARLQPGQWLNDELVNAYVEIIKSTGTDQNDLFATSFFMDQLLQVTQGTETTRRKQGGYNFKKVARWLKKSLKSLFQPQTRNLFIPVNVGGNHWTLVVVRLQEGRIEYYDSLSGKGQIFMNAVMLFLKDAHMKLEGSDIGADWETQFVQGPTQRDGHNCGVFTLMNMLHLSQDQALDYFEPGVEIDDLRIKIARAIMRYRK